MRKCRWLAVLFSLALILGAFAAGQEISLQFWGHLFAGEGSCQQVSETELHCRMVAGSQGSLGLEAVVEPPNYEVTIEGWGLPSWISFQPTSGLGATSAEAILHPPKSAAGQTVLLVFTATTAFDLVTELAVQLEIIDDKPYEEVPGGEETDRGIEIETPFLPGISTFVLGDVYDCVTGSLIAPSELMAQFVFSSDAEPPYDLEQLETVIVRAPGYVPHEITKFVPQTFSMLFISVTLLMPARTPICLEPFGEPSLEIVAPAGACVGNVTTVITDPGTLFRWAAEGPFLSYYILAYGNPCGQYPPEPTPTPTPTPVPGPSPTPTPTGTTPTPTPTDTSTPAAPEPEGQPVTTPAGAWEPLWDKLTPEQREELAKRNLSGWAWVKAAREILGESDEEIPVEGLVEETEGVLLPDTDLIATFGPISAATTETILPLEAMLEPGQAFIWQILGVYENAAGEDAAILSSPQCIRYQPIDTATGEVVPVVSCPRCEPIGEMWDCDQEIQVTRPLGVYPNKAMMNPDERIALSILGSDTDMLLWLCECLEETRRKIGSYPERVSYSWQLTGKGKLVDVFENSAIYELPADLNPNEQAIATIKVTLSAPRGGDKSIEGQVRLTITAGAEGCDDYNVQISIQQPKQESCPPPLPEYGRDCVASLKYGKANGPIAGGIQVYPMAYVGEPILLKATHTDTDELTIKCEKTVCIEPPEQDYPIPDPLAFTWDDQGAGGTFPLGNTGRCVVYIPPKKDTVTVQCVPMDLIVRDPDARETADQPVAEIVIDLTKCDSDWLPEKDNTITFTARIYQYRNGQCTYPGPERRITFDLFSSHETGYCVNRGDSDEMDLFFSPALLQSTFHLCENLALDPSQSTYYTKATTKTRSAESTVTVSSEDYGSYGEIEAIAFNAHAIEPREPEGPVNCTLGDNTVDIPRDDVPESGNLIADAWDKRYPTNQQETADKDESINNNHNGDGLTRYEEYRGVDVDNDGAVDYNDQRTDAQELVSPQNERLSPDLKDLFVTTLDAADFASLAYGKAFENSEIVVHKFRGVDDRGIDILVIDITAGAPSAGCLTTSPLRSRTDLDGHLNKIETPNNTSPTGQTSVRRWTVDWLGASTVGSDTAYGLPKVFDTSIDNYFGEFPYMDAGSFQPAPAGAANPNTWNGAPNGFLDARSMVEDRNDNGYLDPSERDGNYDDGDAVLDGDRLRFAYGPAAAPNFLSRDWDAGPQTASFSVYNRNGDAQVEAPDGVYTRQQVDVMITTHEIGHALGIGGANTVFHNLVQWIGGHGIAYDGLGHCNNPQCTMYRLTNNFTRQDFLCPDCQSLLMIHND